MIKKLLFITILFAQLSVPVYAETVKLNFGVYGSERRNWVDDQNAPILKNLEKNLGEQLNQKVEINVVVFTAYKDAVDARVSKKIYLSPFGGAS
jgi:ABC-type phosphate/phosphonate transport system substrate-binding protein